MKKIHLLLVENCDTDIEFFTESLDESGLSFMCNTARNIEQAFKILKHGIPDAIFINTGMIQSEEGSVNKIRSLKKLPVIFYSTVLNKKFDAGTVANYVQLPHSVETMARIFKNLFIENEIKANQTAS